MNGIVMKDPMIIVTTAGLMVSVVVCSAAAVWTGVVIIIKIKPGPRAQVVSKIPIYLGEVVAKCQKGPHLASPRCEAAQRTVSIPRSKWEGLRRGGVGVISLKCE